ncbi:GGDEF domain-containing protein [Pseudomonas sp. Irchel 3A5]|uniref:GGDEF domain-containing protein n=1 Tax=Pseudomonas sp. Irchel 3A5 TaxID=2008911 RepID=UPI000BA46FDD|nr:GGDEF domain-containing protein [Pseudomonas sp. Irchel 3A5]
MISPNPPKAINFDAAKLKRLGMHQRQVQNNAQPTVGLTQLVQQLGQQLQTSLEAERILGMFFRGVQRLVPLDGLNYEYAESDLYMQMGERAPHSVSYNLSNEGEVLGLFTFERSVRFSEEEFAALESLMTCILFPLRNALLYRAAMQSALRDPLTETGNRVAMDQTLAREIELARRNAQPLSVLMLDIDHFKRVNDTYGHATGDDVLKSIAQAIKSELRNVDQIFRYGGEEFLIVLSNTGRDAAGLMGERLRRAAQALMHPGLDQTMELTISLGGSTLLPAESAGSLMRRADIALYVAKRQGRNRLAMAG